MDDASATPDDLALLRAYEPVVRYTEGELFLPTAVGPYVQRCSLWAHELGTPADTAELVVARAQLADELAVHREQLAHPTRPAAEADLRTPAPRPAASAVVRGCSARALTGLSGAVCDSGPGTLGW